MENYLLKLDDLNRLKELFSAYLDKKNKDNKKAIANSINDLIIFIKTSTNNFKQPITIKLNKTISESSKIKLQNILKQFFEELDKNKIKESTIKSFSKILNKLLEKLQ